MNLGLSFRNLLPSVVREELDALIARIIGGWTVEHRSDGTHSDITARSLTLINDRDVTVGSVSAAADVEFDGSLTLGDDLTTTGDVTARLAQSTSFTGSAVTGSAEVQVGAFNLGGDASEGGAGIAIGDNTGASETGTDADWVIYKNQGSNPHSELRIWTSSQTAGANHLVRVHKPSGTFMITPNSSTTVQIGDSTFGRWGGVWSTTGNFTGAISASNSTTGIDCSDSSALNHFQGYVGVGVSATTGNRLYVKQGATSVGVRIERATGSGAPILQFSDGVTNSSTVEQDTSGNLELKPATSIHSTAKWIRITETAATSPGTGDLTAGTHWAMYAKGDKLIFAFNNGGTVNYYYLDGTAASGAWTHTTTAP